MSIGPEKLEAIQARRIPDVAAGPEEEVPSDVRDARREIYVRDI